MIDFTERLRRLDEHQGYKREHRYKCLDCMDYGLVSIWQPRTLVQAATDVDSLREIDWRECVVLCKCAAAERYAQVFGGRGPRAGKPIPVFGDAEWHIQSRLPDSRAKAVMYQHKPDNYNDEFERFS
jgi:hypothetical protein